MFPVDVEFISKPTSVPALLITIASERVRVVSTVVVVPDTVKSPAIVTRPLEAIAIAAEKDVECVPINLGTGIETSIAELTELIASTVGYKGEVEWDTSKPDGQPKPYLDVSRCKELLGFEAKISLADGIQETVEWYRANPVT